MQNETYTGVVLLSGDMFLHNHTIALLFGIVDDAADINNFLILTLPFIFMWLLGIGFVSYHTDDDGYNYGARQVESKFPRYRYPSTFFIYFFEMLSVMGCTFGVDASRTLKNGDGYHSFFSGFLWNGNYFATFPICAIIAVIMVIIMIIPSIMWGLLKKETFEKFTKLFVHSSLGGVLSLLQDLFLIYLPIQISLQLLHGVPCTYRYGEPAIALDNTALCGSSKHTRYALVGGIVAMAMYIVGVTAGSVPVLVKRYTDLALNGRFLSIAFAIKMMLAVVYVTSHERHRFFHLSATLFLQLLLLFVNLSLRPCLVERINYHRSAAYSLAILPTIMCLVAAGLDDPVASLPLTTLIVFTAAILLTLLAKYFTMACGKLLPQQSYGGGVYKGELVLGLNLPHGNGTLSFEDDDRGGDGKKFTGEFIFGLYHGYGVIVFDMKHFFKGNFRFGKMFGFGLTNRMDSKEEESYEGFWEEDLQHGQGTKKWVDGDIFEGQFFQGKEHGQGTWMFLSPIGKHKIKGQFVEGVLLDNDAEDGRFVKEGDEYEGAKRYGVPHGEGKLTTTILAITTSVNEEDGTTTSLEEKKKVLYQGDWRGGKLHGIGTFKSEDEQYEGHFFQGKYADDGTWIKDEEVYVGRFHDGKKHGHGRWESPQGVYEGLFENDACHGYGVFQYANGDVYQGSWNNNKYCGSGYLKTQEFEYDGPFVDGEKSGLRGMISMADGTEYLGGWLHDCHHDQGVLRLPKLGEYHGKFEHGHRLGVGKFIFNEGSEYSGEWANDRAEGFGKFSFGRRGLQLLRTMDADDKSLLSNPRERSFVEMGGVYTGEFLEGLFYGKGTLVCHDGTTYEGSWEEGLPHGEGTLSFPGGSVYKGEWVEGQREGHGKMTYVDKRVYTGEWSAGRRHGQGILFKPNGDVIHCGEWISDMMVGGKRASDFICDLPTLDVEAFVNDIMPAGYSIGEVEESYYRKRVEMEEICFRQMMLSFLDEQFQFKRIVKLALVSEHQALGVLFLSSAKSEGKHHQKATLAKVLNVFKAKFKLENERDPKKSDIMNDEVAAPLYKKYNALSQKE